MHLKNRNAFTMIEIMLVVIIIGILAAMVIPNLAGRGKQAKVAAVKADIDANLSTALDLFEVDMGRYPTTEEGLKGVIEKPSGDDEAGERWSGPYLKKKRNPLDPWAHEYIYHSPGEHNDYYDLSSMGPDGAESLDDITNWEADANNE